MNELELILTDIFNCSRADLYSNSSTVLKEKEFARLDRILKNRARRIPLQYILGYTEFMGLCFKVQKGVLIPRPETEILVEAAISKLKSLKLKVKSLRILDIGTGSGCIAIALAKSLENINIVAVDISRQAVNLARENAAMHGVEGRIDFINEDIFVVLDQAKRNKNGFNPSHSFDIIITNPPYVSSSEIGMFDKTTAYEPRVALDGGKDGLAFYRRLSKSTGTLLKKDGFLIMEIGYNQAPEIKKIFSSGWNIEEIIKDYQGIERVLVVKQENNG